MKEQTRLYAAYGSNMNIEQMSRRCPNAKVVGVGVIKNFRLTFRGNFKGVANIEPRQGRKVPIVLWDITHTCERALDNYEGVPTLYVQKDVEVIKDNGEKVKAMVYVMTPQYNEMPAEPNRYYLDTIWKGYQYNKIPLKSLKEVVLENQREIGESEKRRFDFSRPDRL